MFDNLRADLAQARKVNLTQDWFSQRIKVLLQPGTIAVVMYRFGHWAHSLRLPVIRHALTALAGIIRYIFQWGHHIHISSRAEIGPGFVIHLPYAIFIPPTAKIGKNCVVNSGVLITWGVRGIGDNVWLGPGARVMGKVRIGNNVHVVANSVVLTDVPDNMMVAGVPARIRWRRGASWQFGDPSDDGDASALGVANLHA